MNDFAVLPVNFRWKVKERIATSGMPETAEQVYSLWLLGIRGVISLFCPSAKIRREFTRMGMRHMCIHTSDHDAIDPAHVLVYLGFVAQIHNKLYGAVLIHCRDGIGSCEAWAALWQISKGLAIDTAISQIICPDSQNQVRSIRRVAKVLSLS